MVRSIIIIYPNKSYEIIDTNSIKDSDSKYSEYNLRWIERLMMDKLGSNSIVSKGPYYPEIDDIAFIYYKCVPEIYSRNDINQVGCEFEHDFACMNPFCWRAWLGWECDHTIKSDSSVRGKIAFIKYKNGIMLELNENDIRWLLNHKKSLYNK